MNSLWRLSLSVLLLLLAACNPLDTRIDASSPEAYQKSLQSIRTKLSGDELKKFDESIGLVAMDQIVPKDGGLLGLVAAIGDPSKLQGQMLAAVNGKTPRQIIEAATTIRKSRAQDELKSVTEELGKLQQRKLEAAASAAILQKIVVAEPSYHVERQMFLHQPTIDFKVTNNTSIALARIYYHGTLTTPGRSIPWVDEDFNHEIAGGLEPGETKHLSLNPNMFSKWGSTEVRDKGDLVLTVRVVNAEGADKKELAATFDASDADRLNRLLKQKGELEITLAAK